jgi:tRNA(Ile)-lysidine synthase
VIDRAGATIERYRMTAAGKRVGVAVSGGADSVFLLRALRELGLAAVVLHINHGLRGPESDADEAFVRELAGRFDLPARVFVAPRAAGNIEQEARRFRYDFFLKQIAEGVCDVVATGHTLDDQAETVLYRFVRGAGTAGLSGILPVTPSGIIRPLLDLRREDIRAWLAERNIPWREDHSNTSAEFARNRIRLQHMPELAASLNPALPDVLASTASWALAEEEYWSGELDRLESQYFIFRPEIILINTKPFLEIPVAAQRRLLRRGILRVRGSLRAIDFRHVEAIRSLMATREGSGRIQLPDLDIYRSFDWLRLAPVGFDSRIERDFEAPLDVPGRTALPERRIVIEMELVSARDVYNDSVQGLDWDRCTGSLPFGELRLRNWRPGDQYQSRGRSAADKIKTLFQEFRVPLWDRRTWPVITRAAAGLNEPDTILWTRKFDVAREFAAGPDSRKILMINEPVIDEITESNPVSITSKRVYAPLNMPHEKPGDERPGDRSGDERPEDRNVKRARGNQFRQSPEPGAEVS